MQRLVLICRHAETHEPYPLQPDFERELTKNGLQQAHQTGLWLRENYRKVDAILASPAKRTAATACTLAQRLYFEEENISFDPDLYNAREANLENALGKLPDEVKIVLLVAHNPGVTQLIRNLTEQRIPYLDPANVVAVSLDIEKWEEIHSVTGRIEKQNM
ncbi:SixA phosphatase family protein [Pontibacter harenae]|uniref:SixA phosphatase family protein n=1 Tax=Pontibacter harenae TaxID=2894083 RepID=UPI001E3FAAB8|nr:histidine phosphatase family protein [Pontibacter harenae]MCC9165550.1 histidine phosphatase family protein [Pontibacter harenae]